MSHGWSARGAQELAQIARGVLDGRRFSVIKNALRPDRALLGMWEERAANKQDGSG
jgi:hypothetical protein